MATDEGLWSAEGAPEAGEPPARPAAGLAHTLEEILGQLRRLVEIDACAFLVVDWERGRIAPAAAWFRDDDVRAAVTPVLERDYRPERPGITEGAIEAARPLLLESVEGWPGADAIRRRLEEDLPSEQAERTWAWYRRASLISAPVATSDGRMLGVLAISSSPPQPPLDAGALRLVEVFADLAAIAIDRAQLLERAARRSRDEARLSRAAAVVSGSLETEEVYRRIVAQAAALVGAPKVALTRQLPYAPELELVAHVGLAPETVATRIPLGAGTIGEVAEARRPYLSRPEDADRYVSWFVEREKVRSFVHVPLEIGPRLFGVLSVSHPADDAFGGHELELLLKFAGSAAAAIANAVDHERERRVTRALTRGFVPVEPAPLADVEIGVRYEPAEPAAAGGDVYGVWPLDSGEVAVVIGDVAGKGLELAALAAMVRFFLEARSWDDPRPAQVLEQVGDALVTRLPADSFASVFLGVVGEGGLRWCNAGHAPPLVVRAGGELVPLGACMPPLGLDEGERRCQEALTPLGAGDLLFAYTDGLYESRREGELFGERRLDDAVRAAVAETGGAPQAFVDGVLERARAWADRMDDDVTLLAVRRAP